MVVLQAAGITLATLCAAFLRQVDHRLNPGLPADFLLVLILPFPFRFHRAPGGRRRFAPLAPEVLLHLGHFLAGLPGPQPLDFLDVLARLPRLGRLVAAFAGRPVAIRVRRPHQVITNPVPPCEQLQRFRLAASSTGPVGVLPVSHLARGVLWRWLLRATLSP